MTILTGDQIPEFRKRVLLRGLKLELKGMKLSKGRSCYSIIKNEFNLKGSRQSVFDQFSELINGDSNEHQT
jgi:hypothetical protein